MPVIDDSPTRVQTTLDPGLELVGVLRPKAADEISTSRWTVDCAGTDREHADWRAIREYVAPLGISRVRVQAGWARCEKDPGRYDFAWLDQIVFDARRRGLSVWMELSYGNPAYPGGGGRQLGAGFPQSPEGLAAWFRWVEKITERYADVVRDWCVWNEPDLKHGGQTNFVTFAADFAIRTAEIVRRVVPAAKIDAFALSRARPEWVGPFVDELVRRDKVALFDTIAYHNYSRNPDDPERYVGIEACRRILDERAPGLRLKQGENGTQSEWCGAGALAREAWTEFRQAKYLLRRTMGDFGIGDDTSVFHFCDLDYRTSGFHDGLLRYGLVKTTGQADGFRVLKVKIAYYAVQNAVSVFNDACRALGPQSESRVDGLRLPRVVDWRDVKTSLPLVVFWEGADRPTDGTDVRNVTVTLRTKPLAAPVWCDLVTGRVHAIPFACVRATDGGTAYAVPAYDSPAFIADRSVLDLVEPWEVTWKRDHPKK